MWAALMKSMAIWVIEKYTVEAVEYGAKALVKKTDTGIDDKVLNIFLDEAVKSKRNNLTKEIKDVLIRNIK